MSKNFVSYDDAQALMQAIEEGKLTVTDTMPAAEPSLLDNTKLYIGPDTATLEKGGVYQCQAIEIIPEGTEDPQAEGWYIYNSVSEEYELTTDTTVVSGTTYYEIKWVNISRADVDLSKYKTIFSGTIAQYEALPAAEKKEYDYIASEEEGAVGADIYSTEEVKTNKVWINGKPIFRKVITLNNPNVGWVATNLANYLPEDEIDELFPMASEFYRTDVKTILYGDFYHQSADMTNYLFALTPSNGLCIFIQSSSQLTKAIFVVEYTKK